jgi:hypothetical protein
VSNPSPPVGAKDPRFRNYRIAAYAVYLLIVCTFCLAVIVSVARSVRAMTPARRASSETTLTVRECLQRAEALWTELEMHRKDLANPRRNKTQEVDGEWSQFRVDWVDRFRILEAECAVESRARESLAKAFHQLDRVMDLYTTHAVQYAGEVGPAVDGLHEALNEAKRDPGAGRLP